MVSRSTTSRRLATVESITRPIRLSDYFLEAHLAFATDCSREIYVCGHSLRSPDIPVAVRSACLRIYDDGALYFVIHPEEQPRACLCSRFDALVESRSRTTWVRPITKKHSGTYWRSNGSAPNVHAALSSCCW